MKICRRSRNNNRFNSGLVLIILLMMLNIDNVQNKLNSKFIRHGIYVRDVTDREEILSFKNSTIINDSSDLINYPSYIGENLLQTPLDSIDSINLTNNQSKFPETTSSKYEIKSMTSNFFIDNKTKSCDVKVIDKLIISMQQPSDRLDYIIISKKTPLYGFTPRTKSTQIKMFDVLEDSSFKQRIYIDSDGKRITFRDRWLVSIQFSEIVKEVEMELEYYMQRALLIDSIKEANFLKFSLINPHPFDVNPYIIIVNLVNYEKLKPEQINVPVNGSVMTNGKEIVQIVTKKIYEKHSEIEVFLTLPYELSTCDGNIVNIVFYGLVFTSVMFVILSMITMFFLSKE